MWFMCLSRNIKHQQFLGSDILKKRSLLGGSRLHDTTNKRSQQEVEGWVDVEIDRRQKPMSEHKTSTVFGKRCVFKDNTPLSGFQLCGITNNCPYQQTEGWVDVYLQEITVCF